MKEMKTGNIETPKNEFLPLEQEQFCLNLRLPVQFKEEWKCFRKLCREQGSEFEDVLGGLIIRFNKEKTASKKNRIQVADESP